jgi:hypothetical protein
MATYDSVFGAQEFINFGVGVESLQVNTVRLHAADGDWYVGGVNTDTVTYFGDAASNNSAVSRISTGAGHDKVFLGAGNFNINLGADNDILGAGNGIGTSFVDVYGGVGIDTFTLGLTGDHNVLIRDFTAGERWGFRTSNPISISFGQTNIRGIDAFFATYGDNTFYFTPTTSLVDIQASCLNTLI